MLVYRIETSKQLGPYRLTNYDPERCHGKNHPGPSRDGLCEDYGDWPRDYYFGFSSLVKLHKWFDHETRLDMVKYNSLKRKNHPKLLLSVYRVAKKHVKIGGRQIGFKIDEAKLVKRLDLYTLA